MTSRENDTPVVLVVEDERDLTELYTEWLQDQYEVRIAYDSDQAMEQMDESVDVVLLDRRLPGMSGDEFLEHVREKGYDCRIAMVSAVDPDFDIVEMGLDEYIPKPVRRDELRASIKKLLSLNAVDDETQTYFAQVAKKEVLENEKSGQELQESQKYADLLRSIESFERRIIHLAETFLANKSQSTGDKRDIYEAGIEKWEQRRRGLDESDPLYQTATEEIQRYEQLLEESKDSSEARRELLEAVADGFVAKGFWLDPRIRRALNKIFFNKLTDSFVINRRQLEPGITLPPNQLFEISETVRQKAREHLESTD